MTYEKKLGTARLIFGATAFMCAMIGWAFESQVVAGIAIGAVFAWIITVILTVHHNIKEAEEK